MIPAGVYYLGGGTVAGSESLIEELEDTVSHGSVAARIEALQHVTDMFVEAAEQYSDEQIELFDEVFNRLIVDLETAVRAILANQLAPIPNAPPIIVRSLAFDDSIEVAGPVLTYSMRLDDAALIYNASVKGQPHLLAISRRESLAEGITDVLVTRGNRAVMLSIGSNPGARFSDRGFGTLVKRSEYDDGLAEVVGSRPDIPRQHFLNLLVKASEVVRQKLEVAGEHSSEDIGQAVREASDSVQATSAEGSREYHEARQLVDDLHRSGQLSEAHVATFAMEGKFEATSAALARLARLPFATVERMMTQDRPEMVLMLAKVAGLSWSTTKAILKLRGGDRGISPHDLSQWMASFERMEHSTAQQVVRFHQMREGRTRPRTNLSD
jgi:uncharacterized protein (DUF2336 family)